MARKTKTEHFAPLKGILPEKEPDENQLEIRAAMDERATRDADALTKELNTVEAQLDEARAEKHKLEVLKEAIHRLIGRYLLNNNMTGFSANGFSYSESFAPVASVTDKHALVAHVLKTNREELLSVHSSTLNAWVCESIEQALNPERAGALEPELAALGITADDTRGKESIGTEGGREAFIEALAKILPPGVAANARTKLSRRKSS